MKIKCENVVRCANTNCVHNDCGYMCRHRVITIGANGQCALYMLKDRPTQNKEIKPYDIEASK
jgi:hypothetical protein